jgi:uncharacterized protein (TIGR03083 family)
MDSATTFVEQNRLLGELLRTADPAAPVPTCPGWSLRQLLAHVGRGHRWAAMIVRERADGPVDQRAVPDGKPPTDPDAAVSWLTDGAALLLDAVGGTGADVQVWTFIGPRPAAWWLRRWLHETVVHRADAALALGVPYTVDAEVAADGVSEWLDLLTARPVPDDGPRLPDGTTLHLHATDDGLGADGEWLVRGEAGRVVWERGHGKGAAAIRGTSADLLQAALGRIPADHPRLQVLGDEKVWRTWLERTTF